MDIREGLAMGLLEIRAHKLRSFLSFLGVMVGVASVMLTLAFLQGAQERLSEGLRLSGPGRLEITPLGNGEFSGSQDEQDQEQRDQLVLDDAVAMRREFPGLKVVSPEADSWGAVVFGDIRTNTSVRGVTPVFSQRDWVYSVRGRIFGQHDEDSFAKVCLLIRKGEPSQSSWWLKYYADYLRDPIDQIFKRYDPLGQDILLNGVLFKVVGVLRLPDEDKDPRLIHWDDWYRVLVPLSTMQEYLSGNDHISEIEVDTGDQDSVPYYTGAIMKFLQARHPHALQSFTIRNRAEMLAETQAESEKMRYVFMGVGIISLLAGGIGIMNVTLAIVFSRIREIGIRRAVGATRLDILAQFILESCLLSFVGGVAGVALGVVAVWLVPRFWTEFRAVTTVSAVLLCLGISVAVGLFFSLYPAWQASRLDPVEALRYE